MGGGAQGISEDGELSEEEREEDISEYFMHKINNLLRQHTTTTELHSVHTVYVETDLAQISLQGSH